MSDAPESQLEAYRGNLLAPTILLAANADA